MAITIILRMRTEGQLDHLPSRVRSKGKEAITAIGHKMAHDHRALFLTAQVLTLFSVAIGQQGMISLISLVTCAPSI